MESDPNYAGRSTIKPRLIRLLRLLAVPPLLAFSVLDNGSIAPLPRLAAVDRMRIWVSVSLGMGPLRVRCAAIIAAFPLPKAPPINRPGQSARHHANGGPSIYSPPYMLAVPPKSSTIGKSCGNAFNQFGWVLLGRPCRQLRPQR